VAVELSDNYQESYKNLERNLGAVKNLRTFSQEGQIAGHQKCSLCGERNFAKEYDKEKLCLVCATKRCDLQNHSNGSFPSLADIVTLDRKDKLNGQDAEAFLDANASEKKHYALLHFDVDNLGKTLSGLPEKGQKELSEKLGEFAQKAKTIVDKGGRTVYAGGDDFLGFVNLAHLFKAIDELYCDFESMKMDLTFSTSIVIAHYKAPLHKVLDYSRELLQESKNHFKYKNGLGIMVMSSNAVISKTICRYKNIALLEELKEKKFAKNLHFTLATIFDYLGEMNCDEFLTQKAMIEVEIKRLLNREKPNFKKDEELKKLYKKLISFFGNQTKGDSYTIDFDNFIGYLKTLEQLRKVM
jgi:CRISPR-associated protein Cmr2